MILQFIPLSPLTVMSNFILLSSVSNNLFVCLTITFRSAHPINSILPDFR